jgi:hypothetical protein
MTRVSHLTSSTFTVGGETTGGKILIPSTVTTGHDLYCMITSRDHGNSAAHPTCVDTDTTGNTFALLGATGSRKGSLYWKKATAGTGGKLITIAGALGSCAAGLSVYSGGFPSVDPTTDWVADTISTGTTLADAFTPSFQSSMVCLAVFHYFNDNSANTVVATNPASLTTRFTYLSTGGSDCGVTHASSFQTGLTTTGPITWTDSSAATKTVMTWAIRPSVVTESPSASTHPISSLSNPVHTYAGAGTYTVKLTVVDNLGASSMTTKAVTVS